MKCQYSLLPLEAPLEGKGTDGLELYNLGRVVQLDDLLLACRGGGGSGCEQRLRQWL